MHQIFFLGNIIDYLCKAWGQLPDHRQPSPNTQYQMVDGVLAAFAVFFLQAPSFLAHQRTMKGKGGEVMPRPYSRFNTCPVTPKSAICSTRCGPVISSRIMSGCCTNWTSGAAWLAFATISRPFWSRWMG